MSLIYAIPLITFFHFALSAEIISLDIKWTAGLCGASCERMLETRLKAIPGVEKVEMIPAQGFASLKWKKNAPYAFPPVNRAMQFIGLSILDIHIKLRGRVVLKRDTYFVVSEGDHTSFRLLSRVAPPNPSTTVEQFNPLARVLTPETREKLNGLLKNNSLIEIDGELFEPERSPPDPNSLILDQYKLVDPKKQ